MSPPDTRDYSAAAAHHRARLQQQRQWLRLQGLEDTAFMAVSGPMLSRPDSLASSLSAGLYGSSATLDEIAAMEAAPQGLLDVSGARGAGGAGTPLASFFSAAASIQSPGAGSLTPSAAASLGPPVAYQPTRLSLEQPMLPPLFLGDGGPSRSAPAGHHRAASWGGFDSSQMPLQPHFPYFGNPAQQ